MQVHSGLLLGLGFDEPEGINVALGLLWKLQIFRPMPCRVALNDKSITDPGSLRPVLGWRNLGDANEL